MFTWFVCWCIKCTVYTNMVVNEVMEGDFRTRLPVKVFLKSPCSNCAKQTFVYGISWCKDSNLHYGINVTKKLIKVSQYMTKHRHVIYQTICYEIV